MRECKGFAPRQRERVNGASARTRTREVSIKRLERDPSTFANGTENQETLPEFESWEKTRRSELELDNDINSIGRRWLASSTTKHAPSPLLLLPVEQRHRKLQPQKKIKFYNHGWKNSKPGAPGCSWIHMILTSAVSSRPRTLKDVTAQDHTTTVLQRTLQASNVGYVYPS